MARRQATIFINGKEVRRDIKSIAAEKRKINNELRQMIEGSAEYNKKAAELDRINPILDKHRKRLRGLPSAYDKMQMGLNNIIGLTAAAFTVDAIIGYGKQLFGLSGQMEILSQKAETVFGETLPQVTAEAEANAAAMGLTTAQYVNAAAAIQDLLIPMGFQRQEAANISLELTNLSGALSEWTGGQIKSEEVARILSKALLGEREELKQLGISIQEADVKARLAEKGLDKLTGTMLQQAKAAATLELITEKSVDAQTAFIQNSDTLVRRQAELSAKISEVSEKLALALLPVFERLIGIADTVANGVLGIVDAITGLANPAKEATEAFNQQKVAVENLERDLVPLIDRYEELKGKSELSKEEQGELKRIISQISGIVPTAITEFDKYGTALDISAGKARDFVEAQKLLLRQQNAEAIDQNTKALQRYEKELDKIASKLSQRDEDGNIIRVATDFSKTGDVSFRNIQLTGEEIQRLQERAAELEVQLKNTGNAVKLLSGESLELSNSVDPNNDPEINYEKAKTALLIELVQQRGDQQAAAELARREKLAEDAAKQNEKSQERERKQIERHLEQLREAEERFSEEARVKALSTDEQELERIRQRYQKEIDLATQLEAQGIQEGTARKLELIRLQEEEIEQFLIAKRQEQLNQDLERIEAEEEAKFQKQIELELGKQAAEKEIRDKVNQALLDEQALQLLQLEEQYGALLQLANQYGIDTTELVQAKEAEQNKIRETFAKKEQERQATLAAIAQARADSELSTFKELSAGLNELLKGNEEAALGLFLFEKGIAAAEVIINLQKELAAISASNASLGPLAPAVIASLSAAAKIRSAIRLATIAGTAIQGITQKKEGGYLNVTGKDDGRRYRARYIGDPQTGMLPPYPVVLASEAGPEYFVSNKDLRNPKVLNYVQAIDNIRRQRVGQFVEGGATEPLPASPTLSSPESNQEVLEMLSEISSKLDSFHAVLDNDTVIGIIRQFNKLQAASGGVL